MSLGKIILRAYRGIYSISNQSHYRYQLPVKLKEYYFFPRSPEHTGSFINAVDIAVPNPEQEQTIVYAPQSGIIHAGVLGNTRWGTSPEDKRYLNWINIRVDEFEFFEIAHISPIPGKILRIGDKIEKGEPFLITALNGRMTKTNSNPDCHVHMLVGIWQDKGVFKSLKIRWEDKIQAS